MKSKRSLHIKDPIYGEVDIVEPLLINLLQSSPVQRIKRINQFGIPDEFYYRKNFSRYDHCVGVMILLRLLRASEEEQAAGLLHDVSHMAFSHVYDWVIEDHTEIGTKNEESQDKGHLAFIQQSEIPQILARSGFDSQKIIDYHFTLLEADSPALCADRIDYSLRELPVGLAKEIFSGLRVVDRQIVCKNFETAAKFGRTFLRLQKKHWGGYESVARYAYFSNALKRALEIGIITHDDFLTDDEKITAKLIQSSDSLILKILQILRENPLTYRSGQSNILYKKFRFIDPPFITKDGLTCLTEVDEDYRKLLDTEREDNRKGVNVWMI